jgi:hypothetical protein
VSDQTFLRVLCRKCHKPVSLKSGTVADENGETIHEQCYVNESVPPSENARLMELYALTAEEQDPKKLVDLVQRINQLLSVKEKRVKATMPKPPAEREG